MVIYSVVICTLDRLEDLKRCILSWLSQKPLPHDIVIVHGRPDGTLEEGLRKLLTGTGVELTYVRMPPSLVRQRNAGIQVAKGDFIFFADDDAVYLEGYAQAILEVYQADTEGLIGGVQGTIDNLESPQSDTGGFARLFLLVRLGNGTLQRSAFPAFYKPGKNIAQVQVFSGPAMSYRKEVLREFQFDDELAHYWVGDDFEMAFRVSRKYKLLQVPQAHLLHYPSPLGRDSARRQAKMTLINHIYLIRKCFGSTWKTWLYWGWSEFGLWLVALGWIVAGRGTAGLLGRFDGYQELMRAALHDHSKAVSNR